MGPNKFLVLFILTALAATARSDDFTNYVTWKMTQYSDWLKSNKFDPSPLTSGPDLLSASNTVTDLDCVLSNHGVRGHSGEIVLWSVNGDLLEGYFYLNFRINGNITFFGEYRANGTLLSTTPISGEGDWHIQIPYIESSYFKVDFEVTPEGYLNLTNYILDGTSLGEFTGEVYFDQLWEDEAVAEYAYFIKMTLFQEFQKYMNQDLIEAKHPFRSLFVAYWRQVLSATHLTDIIGATTPTPSTELPSSPSPTTTTERGDGLKLK